MIAVYAEFDSEPEKKRAAAILHCLAAEGDAFGWLLHGFREKGDSNSLVIIIELEGSAVDAPVVSAVQELGERIGAAQITESYQRIYPRAA